MAFAERLCSVARSGWLRLGLVLSGVWTIIVVLMALASSDPGQNYVAYLLIVPTAAMWCLGYAVGWISRTFGSHEATTHETGADTSAVSLRKQQPMLWWASVFVWVTAIAAAFWLASVPMGNDAHQVARIAASALAIAMLAAVAYKGFRLRTPKMRAGFLLATAFVGAAFVLWQAFDDTQRVSLADARPPSSAADPAASRDRRLADRSKARAKTPRRAEDSRSDPASTASADAAWASALSEALRRHEEHYGALAAKWESDVDELEFEAMLTPETLTSGEGRRQNRERLARFEALLADYVSQLESLQHDYRSDVLAIDTPAAQRADFLKDFEGAFAASTAETQELNAKFERVELDIAKTIRGITDLMEREENMVRIGPDGRTLLFERDVAADDYNALLNVLEKATAEEGIVMAKSSDAFRKRTVSFTAAADLR